MKIDNVVLNMFECDSSKLFLLPFYFKDYDKELEESERYRNIERPRFDLTVGYNFPIILINQYDILPQNIKSFSIDLNKMIPEINIVLVDNILTDKHLFIPKKEDLIRILIKSNVPDKFNSIRCDFAIDSINTEGKFIFINATLYIPNIRNQVCKSYKNKNSVDLLIDIAKELGLGFSSNEDFTDDKQDWVIPMENYEDFLKELKFRIFKESGNNDSYFDIYIDLFYNLTLVNIPKLFDETYQSDMEMTHLGLETLFPQNNETTPSEQSPLFLTNNDYYVRTLTSQFINNFDVKNNFFIVKDGFNKVIQFYDIDTKKYYNKQIEYDYESDSNSELSEPIYNKGEFSTYHWLGSNNSNHYPLFDYSKSISNKLKNLYERNELNISLGLCNFHIFRGIKIPVFIYDYNTSNEFIYDNVNKLNGIYNEEQNRDSSNQRVDVQSTPRLNMFLTGFYMVKDIKIKYDSKLKIYTQNLTLITPKMLNVYNYSKI